MAFSQTEKVMIEAVLAAFVERRRPPVHLRDKLEHGFRMDGQAIELFEVRPRFDDKTRKTQLSFAKARYVKTAKAWKVYWMRGNGRWWPYQPGQVKKVEDFIRLVEEDKDNCFFG